MKLQINTSTVADGSMKIIDEETRQSVMENRDKYLKKNGIDPKNTILVKIIYETSDFCKYKAVKTSDRGDGFSRPSSITADALCTDEYETALFLPIADCIGAVIYSEQNHALMVSHLGRHSIEQNGAFKSVQYFMEQYSLKPEDISIWMSPSVGKETYPLHNYNNQSLNEVARKQFMQAGVKKNKIQDESIDVANHPDYYSHSSFLKGNQPEDGRFAIVAVIRK
jgi:hypothetical protein